MPIHDWTRVDAGIFHDFHQTWMPEIKRALNHGRLPADYYALVEQVAGGRWPDVHTLQGPSGEEPSKPEPTGGVMLAEAPPRVQFRQKAEVDLYAAKASVIVVRHVSGHRVVVVIHLLYMGFIVLGQFAILVGAWRRWSWLRNGWFRWTHLAAITIVACEAAAGIVCPLTLWENELRRLAGEAPSEGTFVGRAVHAVLFFELPPWVFTTVYLLFAVVVLATLRLVPIRRQQR
ncbi:MAG TPA: DUF2784 domain-containing protein [Pirellulales bacterium]|nr:DUF2784 domain-containing protein [Pirellulales bacterium]